MKRALTGSFFMLIFFKGVLVALWVMLYMAACGGGAAHLSDADSLSGFFFDSPVQGITYQTATQLGVTDSQGQFKYLSGEVVTFSVGNLVLGSIDAKNVITPLDVAGTNNINDARVSNLLVFLQSLDVDGNPANGITLPTNIDRLPASDINLALSTDAFQTDSGVINYVTQALGQSRALISAAQARAHFQSSLNTGFNKTKINFAPVANAGSNQNVVQNCLVQLDGSASSDANADTLSYQWTITAKPSGSSANLTNPYTSSATFIADMAGDYVLSLVVSDGLLSHSNRVTVHVTSTINSTQVPPGYVLVWSDEFESTGVQLPDANKWTYDTYMNKAGWFNGELQYYANARLQNSSVQNGKLVITAREENLSSVVSDWNNRQTYTSARLITKGKSTWTYGFFEIRAKLPCGQGTWPAIWSLGSSTDVWPNQGEIDIMEQTGWNKQLVLGTVHTLAGYGGNGSTGSTSLADACTNFHNYQIKWTPTAISFYVDGVPYRSAYTRPTNALGWPFDQPQYLLINLAVGGTLGGSLSTATWSTSSLEVDYVRVYQQP